MFHVKENFSLADNVIDAEFLDFCTILGQDITAIQGAGGNISLKHGDFLCIKASGMLMSQAKERNIFTTVSIFDVLEKLAASDEEFQSIEIQRGDALLSATSMRPSIETPLHALISSHVVVHLHCVDTIVHTLRMDAQENLAKLLEAYSWDYIPYARPGIPLAHSIQKALQRNPALEVFILENHGIIIAGDTTHECIKKVQGIRNILYIKPSIEPFFDKLFLDTVNDAEWLIPTDSVVHSLATSEQALYYAQQGVLYPDHVVFLGEVLPIAFPYESVATACERLRHATKRMPQFLLYPQKGVLLSPKNSSGQNALIHALALVCTRIQNDVSIRTLSVNDITTLLHWDAEIYRQNLKL